MNWTRTPPEAPGIYWMQFEQRPPQLLQIVEDARDGLVAEEFGYNNLDDTMPLWMCWHGALWCGPILPPPLPPTCTP